MNWIDIFISLPILIGVYKGYKRGVLLQASRIFIWVFGLYISKVFCEKTANFLKKFHFVDSNYLSISAIILNFLILILGVYLIRKLAEKILKVLWLNQINRLIGALIGGIKAFILVGIVVFILEFISQYLSLEWKNKIRSSIFFQTTLDLTKFIYRAIFN